MNPFKVGWRQTNHQRRPKRNILKLGENQLCLESVKNRAGNTADIWWEVNYGLRGAHWPHNVKQAPQTVQCQSNRSGRHWRGPGARQGHGESNTGSWTQLAFCTGRRKVAGADGEGKWGQMEIFTVNMRKTWLCFISDVKDPKEEAEDKEK